MSFDLVRLCFVLMASGPRARSGNLVKIGVRQSVSGKYNRHWRRSRKALHPCLDPCSQWASVSAGIQLQKKCCRGYSLMPRLWPSSYCLSKPGIQFNAPFRWRGPRTLSFFTDGPQHPVFATTCSCSPALFAGLSSNMDHIYLPGQYMAYCIVSVYMCTFRCP